MYSISHHSSSPSHYITAAAAEVAPVSAHTNNNNNNNPIHSNTKHSAQQELKRIGFKTFEKIKHSNSKSSVLLFSLYFLSNQTNSDIKTKTETQKEISPPLQAELSRSQPTIKSK